MILSSNHLLIPALCLRCLLRALRNILALQSNNFSSPLPTWIIPTQCCNAKYICLLYQSPPTSYTNELTWYLLKACDSETFHFLWDEKYIVLKRKTNPPHWFSTLLRLRDDSLLNCILCLQLKVTIATELGRQRRQAFARGCRIHAVVLGCTTADAKGR